jgi:polyvinyl alcohol dehydrogenase (cytochrome)
MIKRVLLLSCAGVGSLLAQDGAAIYKSTCAGCHDAPTGRVPTISALKAMSLPLMLQTLERGSMQAMAAGLTSSERLAVTIYLATPEPKALPIPSASAMCTGETHDSAHAPQWTGWSTDVTNTRFQDAKSAGLTATEVPKLKLKWAFGLGGETDARSQPAVADGRMYFGTADGSVYSLDARSGCIHWTFRVDRDVRSAVVIGPGNIGPGNGSAKRAVYFGAGATAYALNASDGKLLWKVRLEQRLDARITGAPQLHKGVLYMPVASIEEGLAPLPTYECCTSRGSVVALDAASGKVLWKTYTIAETPMPTKKSKAGTQLYGPSGAGVWSTPTFDEKRNTIYIATGDNYSDPTSATSDSVLALDAVSGKILWSRQLTAGDAFNNGCGMQVNCPNKPGPDFDFGQPPILRSLPNGKRVLVIGQKSGMAHALDPDHEGAILWQTRVGKGGPLGGSQWGSAVDRDTMYVSVSDIQIKGVVLDSSTPQGYRLELDSTQGGGLTALRLSNGEKVWSAKPPSCGERKPCSPAQSGALTGIPSAVFSGSLDGHLRAYSTATGEVFWDVDTVQEYQTVNGQPARGGSLDGPGPVIAGGMLYVSSGYGQFGGIPGNVLLAFSIDGK